MGVGVFSQSFSWFANGGNGLAWCWLMEGHRVSGWRDANKWKIIALFIAETVCPTPHIPLCPTPGVVVCPRPFGRLCNWIC